MAERNFEHWLASLPLRRLDAQREAQLLAALHAAATPARDSRPTWRVPAWQAAACLLAGLLLGLIAGRAPHLVARDDPAPPAGARSDLGAPLIVRVDAPIFARAAAPTTPRASHWQSLNTHQGDLR